MLKEIRQKAVVQPGGVIELTSADFPVGTSVEVVVLVDEGRDRSTDVSDNDKKWADFYKDVVGAWKDDEEINQIFKEIERDRRRPSTREMPIFNNDAD